MTFSTFNLFADASRTYTNPASLKAVAPGLASSFTGVHIPGDNILGLLPGITLSSLQKRKANGYGFIVDTVTNEKLAFQYNVIPTESGGAEITEHMTLARSAPILHYKGGKSRTLTMNIEYTIQKKTREDVLRSMRWLQALAYPDYTNENEIVKGPHPVVVVQGKLYATDLWIVRDFSITWGSALDPVTQLPEAAAANLTLLEYAPIAKGQGDFLIL